MSKKKWLALVLFFIATHAVHGILRPYVVDAFDYAELVHLQQELQENTYDQVSDFQEDRRIYVAVAIPDYLISTNEEINYALVKQILFSKGEEWFKKRADVEKRFKHHTYVFHPVIKKQIVLK